MVQFFDPRRGLVSHFAAMPGASDSAGRTTDARSDDIDPASWYSDRDLLLMLDIGRDGQNKARSSGQLRYKQVGTTYLYKGEWVLDYFESLPEGGAQPNDVAGRARPAVRSAAPSKTAVPVRDVRSTGSSQAAPSAVTRLAGHGSSTPTSTPTTNTPTSNRSTSTMSGPSAKQVFDGLVAEKVRTGMTRQNAVRAVVREHPDLHRSMLREANTERPEALRRLG